jgi:hypothetical protein
MNEKNQMDYETDRWWVFILEKMFSSVFDGMNEWINTGLSSSLFKDFWWNQTWDITFLMLKAYF